VLKTREIQEIIFRIKWDIPHWIVLGMVRPQMSGAIHPLPDSPNARFNPPGILEKLRKRRAASE
jgi:hypothetical protein